MICNCYVATVSAAYEKDKISISNSWTTCTRIYLNIVPFWQHTSNTTFWHWWFLSFLQLIWIFEYYNCLCLWNSLCIRASGRKLWLSYLHHKTLQWSSLVSSIYTCILYSSQTCFDTVPDYTAQMRASWTVSLYFHVEYLMIDPGFV